MKNYSGQPTATARPRHHTWKWPLIVVGLLVAHVTGMMTAVTIATRDKSFIVLPNYYQKALEWDQRKSALAAADKLGWERRITLGDFDASHQTRLIRIEMVDRNRQPLEGLSISITAAPEKHPDRFQTLQLTSQSPGSYVGHLKVTQTDVWSVDIDAKRGNEHYVSNAKPWIGE